MSLLTIIEQANARRERLDEAERAIRVDTAWCSEILTSALAIFEATREKRLRGAAPVVTLWIMRVLDAVDERFARIERNTDVVEDVKRQIERDRRADEEHYRRLVAEGEAWMRQFRARARVRQHAPARVNRHPRARRSPVRVIRVAARLAARSTGDPDGEPPSRSARALTTEHSRSIGGAQ